jgi:hypothetical protein
VAAEKSWLRISLLIPGTYGLLPAVLLLSGVGYAQLSLARVAQAEASQWIQPRKPGDPLLWGRRDGIVFGLPSERGLPGPRGLIRVGVISAQTGLPELLNFIAIEPVVRGRGSRGDRMAFSELEPSQMDPGLQGKRLWVGSETRFEASSEPRSEIRQRAEAFLKPASGRAGETLSVRIEVERFQSNGAHVYVVASIDGDHPQELRIAVFGYEDSPAIEELTLTATMGNYERLRWLWLKNRIVDSRQLYGSYRGEDFADRPDYPLRDMLRTAEGDAVVLCTSNEASPQSNYGFNAPDHWRYRLGRLTQYWKVPAPEIESNLRVRLNGRRVYWASHAALAGGIAFENFEVRQRYKAGQTFIFGVTAKEPWEIMPPIPFLASPRNAEAN